MKVYYIIQGALSLEIAADYANDLRLSFKLYQIAVDIVQRAWDHNPTVCRAHPAFESQMLLPWDATLLGRLKRSMQRVEQELEKANGGIWNTVRGWFSYNE